MLFRYWLCPWLKGGISSPCSEVKGSILVTGLQEITASACTWNLWGRTCHSLLTTTFPSALHEHARKKHKRQMGQTERKQLGLCMYLCELHAGRVSDDRPIRHLIPSVSDELAVPNTEIVFPISPLGEDSDGWSAQRNNQTPLQHSSTPNAFYLLRKCYQQQFFYISETSMAIESFLFSTHCSQPSNHPFPSGITKGFATWAMKVTDFQAGWWYTRGTCSTRRRTAETSCQNIQIDHSRS